jgi:ComF family protein
MWKPFQIIEEIILLFFPRYCALCNRALIRAERITCLHCWRRLPWNRELHHIPIAMDQLFWGRCQILACTYLLTMSKRGTTRKLIHQLKYRGVKEIGFYLGEHMGRRLTHHGPFNDADAIVPVPMSMKKRAERGYNQAEVIAEGLSSAMKIPLESKWLLRSSQQGTQTNRGRMDRWLNASSDYVCIEIPTSIQRILLVDDVVTTGATIESCVQAIRRVREIEIIVVCLALPVRR